MIWAASESDDNLEKIGGAISDDSKLRLLGVLCLLTPWATRCSITYNPFALAAQTKPAFLWLLSR